MIFCLLMSGGDGFQGCLEVVEGLSAVDRCNGEQEGDARPSSLALVMSGEGHILAGQGDRPDQVFDAVGVDLDAAVAQEGLQPVLVTMDIGQLLAKTRLIDMRPLCNCSHSRKVATSSALRAWRAESR